MRQVYRPNRALFFLTVAAAFLLPALPALADMNYPAFLASLTPGRAEYWVGEPVSLRCHFVNWVSPSVEITSVFGLHGSYTDLRIASEGKEGDPYHAQFDQSVASEQQVLLRYAKAHEFEMQVLYDPRSPDKLALSKPGVYQFHLQQNIWYTNHYLVAQGQVPYKLEAVSRPIHVIAPPEEFAGALRLLLSRPPALIDLNRHLANPANWQIMETVVAQYPKSRYAPHCLHALVNGRLFFAKVSSEYLREALKICERLVREYPDYASRDEMRVRLAELYKEDGQLDKTLEIVTQLLAESEENLYRFRKSSVMRPFRGARENPYAVFSTSCWELFGTTRLNDANFQVAAELD